MASDRPVDSYEGLTLVPILVDKRVPGRDAGPLTVAALIAANGNLLALLIIGGVIFLFVLAGYAIFKMRKDEFWDEPPG
jgi:hypothetical protein